MATGLQRAFSVLASSALVAYSFYMELQLLLQSKGRTEGEKGKLPQMLSIFSYLTTHYNSATDFSRVIEKDLETDLTVDGDSLYMGQGINFM